MKNTNYITVYDECDGSAMGALQKLSDVYPSESHNRSRHNDIGTLSDFAKKG